MKQTKKEIILEILRFLIVGGIATISDYLVFYSLEIFVFHNEELFNYTVWNVNKVNRRDFMEDKVYAEYVYTLAAYKLEILYIALSSKDKEAK